MKLSQEHTDSLSRYRESAPALNREHLQEHIGANL